MHGNMIAYQHNPYPKFEENSKNPYQGIEARVDHLGLKCMNA